LSASIEDDEIEIVSITHNGLIESILPGHKQLQHHEIGEKNIGTELLDSFSLFLALLSCIPFEGWPKHLWQPRLIHILSQFLELAVLGQCGLCGD
jgi:hypothetical protein